MDPTSLSERLTQAEAHVIGGQRRIARQKQLILILRASGRDTSKAESVLERMRGTQSLRLGELRRIRGVLARRQNGTAQPGASPAATAVAHNA